MSLIRKHGAVLQAWACLDLVSFVAFCPVVYFPCGILSGGILSRDIMSRIQHAAVVYIFIFKFIHDT